MNYTSVYESAFSNITYSAEHHIQYDYVLEKLQTMFARTDTFEVIDIGSGRGHLIRMILASFPNVKITSVDLKKFNDITVESFIECNLSKHEDRVKLLGRQYDVLLCMDVLEHLDKSFIHDIFSLFSKVSNRAIISIANHSDILNGVELHTIQESYPWWNNLIDEVYIINENKYKYNDRLFMYDLKTKAM